MSKLTLHTFAGTRCSVQICLSVLVLEPWAELKLPLPAPPAPFFSGISRKLKKRRLRRLHSGTVAVVSADFHLNRPAGVRWLSPGGDPTCRGDRGFRSSERFSSAVFARNRGLTTETPDSKQLMKRARQDSGLWSRTCRPSSFAPPGGSAPLPSPERQAPVTPTA